jgi:hypothetical protein
LWWVFGYSGICFGLPGCFFWLLGAGNVIFLTAKRGQIVVGGVVIVYILLVVER